MNKWRVREGVGGMRSRVVLSRGLFREDEIFWRRWDRGIVFGSGKVSRRRFE